MYLPTTVVEMERLGWAELDVVLVSGDTYVDSPYFGVAVIGRVLEAAGYKVGVIAQPDVASAEDIGRLGRPRLFFGVTGGSVDSMVANYTATRKFRNRDDYTPGGVNDRRPDRAVIKYTNLIRQRFKPAPPIVLGGLEASLRRVAHYDFWSDGIRRSVLVDSGADFLVHGMGERSVVELARALESEEPGHRDVRGLAYLSREPREGYLELPSFEEVAADKASFTGMFHAFYKNNDPRTARGLVQRHGDRYVIQNPPAHYLTQEELDRVYGLPFERGLHPHYRAGGKVRAMDTIRASITTHRGCYGGCNFCAISVHQGRTVRWRSEGSILEEARRIAGQSGFKGRIMDVGGPTANMYGFECEKKLEEGCCDDMRCLFPEVCSSLEPDHGPQLEVLRKLRALPGVEQVVVASGLRYDLVLEDGAMGPAYLRELVAHHVSGQLKVAPEHADGGVLARMGKPGTGTLERFKEAFDRENRRQGKKQFLTYYLVAAHPGCGVKEMHRLKDYAARVLKITPEQVQIFTPTPSTYSTLMYYTGRDPWSGDKLFVERDPRRKNGQKRVVTGSR